MCGPGASRHTHASEVRCSENKSEANYQSQRTEAFVLVQKEKKQKKTDTEKKQSNSYLPSLKKSLDKTDLPHSEKQKATPGPVCPRAAADGVRTGPQGTPKTAHGPPHHSSPTATHLPGDRYRWPWNLQNTNV